VIPVLILSLATAAKPNLLLVVTDDQAFDAVGAVNAQVQTPALDGLYRRGMVFSNAYCQGSLVPAVCVPSRTMLLSGRSLFRIPDPKLKEFAGPTLGQSFREAGYYTGCITKPGNSFAAAHRHFETVVHQPHANATTACAAGDAALKFLQDRPKEKPFLLYLAPSTPHDPRVADPEIQKLYDPAKIILPKNFMAKAPWDLGVAAIRDEKLAPTPRDPAEMRKQLAEYYAMITDFDRQLARVLLEIEKTAPNTIVVFTSDQGLAVGGRHGLMGKQNLYEHVKPPFVIAGPGIPAGKSAALVYLFDLFPTLCDYAGIATPKECEGASLKMLISGGAAEPWRKTLFTAYAGTQRCVRDARYKLYWLPKADRVMLFDLQTDPDELQDLSEKEPAKVKELKGLLAQEQAHWADTAPAIRSVER
jgi:arylsulfatase A-like enzyme